MDQKEAKEYLLTMAAVFLLPGGTIFSLLYFKPTGMSIYALNNLEAVLGMSIFAGVYMWLIHKRDKSIDERIKISLIQ